MNVVVGSNIAVQTHRCTVDAFQLQRGVVDPVMVRQHPPHRHLDLRSLAHWNIVRHQVSRKSPQGVGDAPDVQVVHAAHAFNRQHVLREGIPCQYRREMIPSGSPVIHAGCSRHSTG